MLLLNDLIVLFTLFVYAGMKSSNQAHLASAHLVFHYRCIVQEVSIHMCMCTCMCVCVCVCARAACVCVYVLVPEFFSDIFNCSKVQLQK